MGKWGSCNFEELKRFQKQLEAVEREKDAFCRQCANDLAQRLLALTKKRTPTGQPPKLAGPKTVKVKGASGKSRSFLSAEGIRHEKYWSGYSGGTLKRGWTTGKIQKTGDTYEIEVINSELYASYVEYGHRQTPGRYVPAIGKRLKTAWVPGKFMLTKSVADVQRMAPARLQKELQEFLRRCLDAE